MAVTDEQTVTVAVNADTGDLVAALNDVERLSRSFGSALGAALDQAAVKGRSLDAVLSGLALRLSRLALNAALKPVEAGIGSLLENLVSGVAGAVTPFANGGIAMPRVTPFAGGGLVAAPTYFPMNGGMGLAGEAGPEAIMPLARDDSGRLGVRTSAGAMPANVTVNIATPNVDSFRRSEAQVAAALARAVGRGRRGL